MYTNGGEDMKPLRMEIVGMLPQIFNLCVSCQVTDFFQMADVKYQADELAGFPPEVLATQSRVAALVATVVARYGERVWPITVDPYSPRGLWLSLRHHLHSYPAIILDGNEVLSDLSPEKVLQALARRLEMPATTL